MSLHLQARLVGSLVAPPAAIDLDTLIEERIIDLKRIRSGIVYGRNPPGLFTARKLEAVASRLLQAAEAIRLADVLSASPVTEG